MCWFSVKNDREHSLNKVCGYSSYYGGSPMIRFLNGQPNRGRSILLTGLLVLIIYLLTMDTKDRKPFLRKCVGTTCNLVRTAADWVGSFAESESVPIYQESPRIYRESQSSEATKRSTSTTSVQETTASRLPTDFFGELQAEMQRSTSVTAHRLWSELVSTTQFERQADLSILLAIELPPRIWTVNSVRISQDDLADHIGNPNRTVLY